MNLVRDLPKPVTVLDTGGTVNFWNQMGMLNNADFKLTILNIESEENNYSNIKFVKGDARNLSCYKDSEFDIVFSNSVIEHVGSKSDQEKMASEIVRTGKRYYVQTPNYYFPFEPHFLFPLFQFFPLFFKKFLLKNFSMGWFDKANDDSEAMEIINSIRLLRKKEFRELFPDSMIIPEKLFWISKSFVAIGGKNFNKLY